jgi:hypothetical protein
MLKVLLFTGFVCLSSFVEAKKDFTYSSSFENNKIKKSYTNDGKNFQYDYGNGQKFWGSSKKRFCIYDGRTYNDRDHENFNAVVNKLNDGDPYLKSVKPIRPIEPLKPLKLGKDFFKDFFAEPSKKESKEEIGIRMYKDGIEICMDKRDKNGIEGFSCRYPNGDAYSIKDDAAFCTLKGQKYDSRYDNNFDDMVKQLNNGNPTPHFLEPYKHLFTVKHDGLDVADVYKKSLENMTNWKLRKKIENIVKGWLKRINSKKYKQHGLVSDDVYRAAYKALDNGHVTVKNIAKRVKEKIEEFSRAER